MLLRGRGAKLSGALTCAILLVLFTYLSITLGATRFNALEVMQSFTDFTGTNKQIIIKDIRVPRALTGAAVGMSLGIAGTLLQALTKNPLADTGILGINEGAAFFVVIGISFFSASSLYEFAWLAFAGATVSGITVYILGSLGRNGLTPVKLTLGGAALSAMASSITHGLLVINEANLSEVLFWLTGSVQGRKLEILFALLPYLFAAVIGSFMIAGSMNILLLGDDVAKGLGQKVLLTKLTAGLLIILLAGSSVAMAGPISFVGLVIPHFSRFLSGIDLRWNILYSGLLGAILVLAADILARYLVMPGELPVGIVTAMLGAPFFILTARRTRRS